MTKTEWDVVITVAKKAKEELTDADQRYGAQYVIVALAELREADLFGGRSWGDEEKGV